MFRAKRIAIGNTLHKLPRLFPALGNTHTTRAVVILTIRTTFITSSKLGVSLEVFWAHGAGT